MVDILLRANTTIVELQCVL